MDARSILLSMLPVCLTLINYAIVRDLLWGIFLGNKSKKTAAKIKAEQKGWAKFTQSYMTEYIKKYEKEYYIWSGMRRFLVFLTLVQIIAFTVMIILGVPFWVIVVICSAIVVFNILLFCVMMMNTAPSDNKHDRKGSPWKFEQ